MRFLFLRGPLETVSCCLRHFENQCRGSEWGLGASAKTLSLRLFIKWAGGEWISCLWGLLSLGRWATGDSCLRHLHWPCSVWSSGNPGHRRPSNFPFSSVRPGSHFRCYWFRQVNCLCWSTLIELPQNSVMLLYCVDKVESPYEACKLFMKSLMS